MTRRRVASLAGAAAATVGLAVVVVTSAGDGRGGWGDAVPAPVPAAAAPGARAAVGPDGRVHALWTVRRAGRWSLLAAERSPGGPWSAPTAIVRDRPFAVTPVDVAGGAGGDVAALWALSGRRRGVLVASARPTGAGWAPEQAVSRVRASPSGRVAVGPDGAVTVVGRGLDGPGLWAVRRAPDGRWTPARRISPPDLTSVDAPALAAGPDGRLLVAALAKRAGAARTLFAVEASASGAWGPARALPGSAAAGAPAAGRDGAGRSVVAWARDRRRPDRTELLSSVRSPGGDWTLPSVRDRTALGSLGAPALVTGDGAAHIAWARWDGRPEERRAQIRATEHGAPAGGTTVAAVRLPPVGGGPVPASDVIYGAPPLHIVAGDGPAPVLAWGQPAGAGSTAVVSRRAGGVWSAPVALGPPSPGGAIPLVARARGEGASVVWAGAPAGSPTARILVSER